VYEHYLTGLIYYPEDYRKIEEVLDDMAILYEELLSQLHDKEAMALLSFKYHFITGGAHYAIIDFNTAERKCLQAIQLFDQLEDTLITADLAAQYAKTYFNLCGIYIDVGKYEEAIHATQYILNWTADYFDQHNKYWNFVGFRAEAAMKLHKYQEAFNGYQFIYNRFLTDKKNRDSELKGIMLIMADLSLQLRDESTYHHYMKKINLLPQTPVELAYYKYNQANFWLPKDTIKGISFYKEAIDVYGSMTSDKKNNLQFLKIHEKLAALYLLRNDFDNSKIFSTKIIELSEKSQNRDEVILKKASTEFLINAYSSLLRIARKEDDIESAKRYADQLLKSIILIKNDDYFLNDKIRLFRKTYEYFGQLIDFYDSQDDMDQIFLLMRQSKAQIIKESEIKRKNRRFGSDIEDKLLTDLKVKLLDKDIPIKQHELNKNKIYKLQENINFHTSSKLKASLIEENKNGHHTLSEFQNSLIERSLVIEYYLGSERSYCMMIDQNQSKLFRLEADSVIGRSVLQYITGLKSKSINSLQSQEVQKVVWPTSIVLDQYEYLMIIPDGVLHYLPFELFKVGEKSIIEQVTISHYLYSDMVINEDENRIKELKLLAIAPSFISSGKDSMQPKFDELLYNKVEVSGILNFIDGHNLSDTSATKFEFLNQYAKHNIFHFSTHAQIQDDSEKSFIAFSNADKDYKLYQHQIPSLDFNAAMVVLSACETGIGEVLKGESMFSLKKAFFQSGCQSVISSLWAVNDQCTAEIMTSFYKYLDKGMRKDDALRFAKLDYIEVADPSYRHPYYWAGFTVAGDTSPIGESNSIFYYALIVILAVLSLFSIINYRRKIQLS